MTSRLSDPLPPPPSTAPDRVWLGLVAEQLLAHPLDPRSFEVVDSYLRTFATEGSRRAIHNALELVASIATQGQRSAKELQWWRIHPFMMVVVRHDLIDRSRAPSTLRRTMSACRGVFEVCHLRGLLDEATLRALVDAARQRAPLQHGGKVLSPSQIDALLASCDGGGTLGLRDRAVLALLLSLLRPREVVALGRRDWDPATRAVRIAGKRARTVVLDPRFADLVHAWVDRRGHGDGSLLSPIRRGHRTRATRSLSLGTVRDIVRARAERAGLGRLTPTDLRRAALARALAEGWSAAEVAARAGLHDAKGLAALARRVAADRIEKEG